MEPETSRVLRVSTISCLQKLTHWWAQEDKESWQGSDFFGKPLSWSIYIFIIFEFSSINIWQEGKGNLEHCVFPQIPLIIYGQAKSMPQEAFPWIYVVWTSYDMCMNNTNTIRIIMHI